MHKPSGEVKRLAACIYGPGGVGKTTLLGTLPGAGLVIDIPQAEDGTCVLDGKDNIDVLPVRRWEELEEVHARIKSGNHNWKWIAVDSVTAVQKLAKRKAVKERPLDADPHIVSQQDYGKIGELMEDFVFKFRLLPITVIFTAQERYREGVLEPDLTPASLSGLKPSMFLIGRMFVVESDDGHGNATYERRMRVQPHANYCTKVRAVPSRPVPPVVSDPHLGELFRWFMGREGAKPPIAVAETLASFELD